MTMQTLIGCYGSSDMMKRILVAVLAANLCSALAAESVKLRFPLSSQMNYEKKTKIVVGAEADGCDFKVLSAVAEGWDKSQHIETAWVIFSDRLELDAGAYGYALEFEIKSDDDWKPSGGGGKWSSRVFFYDAAGKELEVRPLIPAFKHGDFAKFRFAGRIPPGAKSMTFSIGKDDPNIVPGKSVSVRNATYAIYKAGEAIPPDVLPDMRSPMVRSLFKAPTENRNLVVRYEITDETAIDWQSVVVSNVLTKSTIPFVRKGNVITLKPGAPWPEGAQRLTVSVCDGAGNATLSQKAFMIGKSPATPRFTLRDDGMTLVDGKPFFPIGIYGVGPHMFNAWNLDRAVCDLKAAGFNIIHSYFSSRDPDLLAAARKYGVYCWTAASSAVRADDWFVNVGRNDPSILSWYNGDDTSRNTSPSQLLDRDEACRMLDGTRITCQADGIGGRSVKSNYEDFVPYTDVFLPEVYWVYYSRASDAGCVAKVICDVDRARSDIKKFGKDRPHGVWPIIQAFHGRMWHRFPDEDEFLAMSYAAIIHGGNGITWFHYAGELNEAMKHRYSGCFQTKRDWAMMTNLTTRLSLLSPVLVERTPPQPKTPEVLSGAKDDPLGQPSVTVLVKNHAGAVYVFAVNASPKPVKARIFAEVRDGEGSVAWENRRVRASGGSFEDDFRGFGVHVYRFAHNAGGVK